MVRWRKEGKGPEYVVIGGLGQGRKRIFYPVYKLEEFRKDNPQPNTNKREEFYTLDDLSTRNADSPPGRFGRISRSTVLKSLTSEPQWKWNGKTIIDREDRENSRIYIKKDLMKKCLLSNMGIDDDKVSRYVNIQEAAQIQKISVGNLHALHRNKKGPPCVKFGQVRVYPLEPLEQYIQEDESIQGAFGEHRCARELGVSIDTLREWRKKGVGPKWVEFYGKIYYLEDEVKQFKDKLNQKL